MVVVQDVVVVVPTAIQIVVVVVFIIIIVAKIAEMKIYRVPGATDVRDVSGGSSKVRGAPSSHGQPVVLEDLFASGVLSSSLYGGAEGNL